MSNNIGALRPAYSRIVGEPDSDLHGFVVIDSFVSGRGTGGIRCTEDLTFEEVARLAREMTHKFAFLHLPSGGAKAGLVAPPGMTAEDRGNLFRRFGEAVGDLIRDGKYVSGLDMGTYHTDIRAVMSGAGLPIREGPPKSAVSSSYFTALTALVTAEALVEARGRRLQDTTVLIEGVGKVGGHLLRFLRDSGARVLGVSTRAGAIYDEDGLSVDSILQASSESGDEFVKAFSGYECLPSSDLFTQRADLLIPGGGADSLNDQNIDQIKARWIVPVANICATAGIEAKLYQRGIEFVPGFVSNSGGVFCWYLSALSGDSRELIIRDRFKARIQRLIRVADRSGQSIPDTARSIADRNLAAMQDLDNGKLRARLLALARKLSPRRIGFVIGTRLFGQNWGRASNVFVRAYYDARYFS